MNNHTRKITLFVLLLSLASLACSLTASSRTTAFDAPLNRATLASTLHPSSPTPSPTRTPAPAVCVVTAHALTLRAGPSVETLALDYLTRGQFVTILSTDSTWWHVSTPTGQTGYIHSRFCERK